MRLTRKCKETPYTPEMYDFNIVNNKPVSNYDIIQKLGQYEDLMEKWCIENIEMLDKLLENHLKLAIIEDELGIDLITLFKAYHNGFYIKYEDGLRGFIRGGEYYLEVRLETKCFTVKEFEPNGTRWYFKDYGKTWALIKEELE